MKELYRFLNIAFWCVIGVFIGVSLYQCYDYIVRPGLYALTSAPWYFGILLTGLFAALLAAVIRIAMWLVKRKISE